jgi:hypothetical protein
LLLHLGIVALIVLDRGPDRPGVFVDLCVRFVSILTALFAILMILGLQRRQSRKLRSLHEG